MNHEVYMERCLQLANNGRQFVSPNPMVGSVIVHDEKIIGEGYHRIYGGPHAEVNAINSVKNRDLIKESTLYVNLEPCAHHGKTPPCSDLIIRMQIPRVVIGCLDSYAEVAGKGIEKMRKAGIEVIVGVLEAESLSLNRRFFTFHSKKRPFVILKWAETIDGYIDIERGGDNSGIAWITHPYLRIPVHKWRAEEMGIMIGKHTAINDNPSLTTRMWSGNNPARFVFDREAKLPNHLSILDKSTETHVFTEVEKDDQDRLTYMKIDYTKSTLKQVLDEMYRLEIQSVIIEGGRTLIQSFIDENLWDEARVFVGNKTFGSGSKGPLIKRRMKYFKQFGEDRILCFENY